MVSVLIPVFNTDKKWLFQCHLSIMNQAINNIDVVYVDDCSTNKETLDFLSDVEKNPFCRVIHLPKNSGISKALNVGLAQCKYDLVARMDSDDIMVQGRLKAQLDYMTRNPFVDCLGTQINLTFLENGAWVTRPDNTILPTVVDVDAMRVNDYVLAHPTVMFRKNKVISIGGYDESLRGFSEDFELWARMLKNKMVIHNLPHRYLNYRISDDALTKKLDKANHDFIQNIRETYFVERKELKIGFLVIATNKYTRFVKPLVDSINNFFLPQYEKTIFCFTDDLDLKVANNVIKVYQEHLPWPMPTLKRYEIFYNNQFVYQDVDVLYYLDADMLINSRIDEDVLPDESGLVAVIHPGYTRDKMQSFERNKKSLAFVDSKKHHVYHCGGFQGGTKKAYLDVCAKLKNNINIDSSNGITAEWHDESHWNAFLVNNPNSYKELDSSYCYPESWSLPIQKRILALDKDHKEIRS